MHRKNAVTYGPMVLVLRVRVSFTAVSDTTGVFGDVIVLFSSSLQ